MKLSIHERLVAMGLMPKEANYLTRKSIAKAMDELGFSDEEIKIAEIKSLPDGRVSWKLSADPMKDVALGEIAEAELVKALKELDSKSKLTDEHVSLYEKFVVKQPELSLVK